MKKVLESKHISQTEASNLLGVGTGCFNHWILGRRNPSVEDVKKFCDIFNVSPNFLYGIETELKESNKDSIQIDVLDVKACCGNGIINFNDGVIGHQYVSRSILNMFSFSSPTNIKIIEAVGDSMTPTINPYDMLWIDISIKEPSNDGLYLLMVGENLMIKRIQINPFNNQVQIKSDNTNYAPIIMNDYHEIRCLGRVIYHMKRVG